MKLLLSCLVFLLLISCSTKQFTTNSRLITDTLKRYSYLIVAYKNGTDTVTGMGTGFFVEADSDYYFITAKHIITGISPFTLKSVNGRADFITIFFHDSSGNAVSYLDIPMGQVAKATPIKRYYEEPDIIILQFAGLEKARSLIHCISLKSTKEEEKFKKLTAWGYGVSNTDSFIKSKNVEVKDISPMYYEGTLADEFHIDPGDYKSDTLNIHIQPTVARGMSGAPAFYQYRAKQSLKEIFEFAGVLFGGNDVYHSGFMVSSKALMQKITDPQFPKYFFRY